MKTSTLPPVPPPCRHVSFEAVLRLRKPLLDETCPNTEFRLVSTVSHHGRHAAGAAVYTTHAFVLSGLLAPQSW